MRAYYINEPGGGGRPELWTYEYLIYTNTIKSRNFLKISLISGSSWLAVGGEGHFTTCLNHCGFGLLLLLLLLLVLLILLPPLTPSISLILHTLQQCPWWLAPCSPAAASISPVFITFTSRWIFLGLLLHHHLNRSVSFLTYSTIAATTMNSQNYSPRALLASSIIC